MAADPQELLAEELREDDIETRVSSIRHVKTIATALGPERTRKDLLPFLRSVITEQDDEVLMAIAEELGGMVDVVGGPDHAHLLLPLLEALAEVEETVVRERASTSLNAVGQKMPPAQLTEHFISLVKRLAASEMFASRISACGLFATSYSSGTSVVKASLRKLFNQLATDEMPMVRTAAFAHLPELAAVVSDKSLLISDLLPLFQRLSQDEQEQVRCLAVENLVKISKLLSPEENTQAFLSIIHGFSDDKCAKVRIDRAKHLCDLSDAVGSDVARTELVPVFLKLLADPETDVRAAATTNLAKFCLLLEPQAVVDQVVPIIKTLVVDPQQPVRVAVSEVLGGMTGRMGSAATLTHIMPLFVDLLQDEVAEVRMNVVQNLGAVHSTVGNDALQEHMLPPLIQLAEDKQWRVRLAVVDALPLLAQSIGVSAFETHLKVVQTASLIDSVAAVREASALNLIKLAQSPILGQDWVKTHCLPVVEEISKTKGTYLFRVTALYCVSALCSAFSPAVVAESLLPIVLSLTKDPVANVRFATAKCLGTVASVVDAAVFNDRIKPVLSEMESDADLDVKYYAAQSLQMAKK